MVDKILIDPERKTSSFRPLVAIRHLKMLLEDSEDTEQVYHVRDALRGRHYFRNAFRFIESEQGREIYETERDLAPLLDDHDRLHKMPSGSLGKVYADFMEHEGLTAAGLVAVYDAFSDSVEKFDDMMEWYIGRLRDTHDLLHVLTGYGRDVVGEQSLLAFSHGQFPNLGAAVIAYGGGLEVKRRVPVKAPVISSVREGHRLGKAAQKFAYTKIMDLLPLQVDEVRRKLNIGRPGRYFDVMEAYRNADTDLFDYSGEYALPY